MPGSDLRLVLMTVAMLVVTLVAAGEVRADYKQDYARGQEAAADGNWVEVERFMQEAMSGSTTPATRVRLYGQRFAPYVPQYYLGLAAFRTNNCTEAMRWFNDPQAAPVIAQVPDFKGVADDARQQCKTAAAPTAPKTTPTAPPPKPVAQTEPANTQPLASNPTPPKPAEPKPAEPKPLQPPPTAPTRPSQPPPANPPATAAVPAVLSQALGDYLAGRFAAASRASPSGLTGKAKAHLHLIRAASLLGLAEAGSAQGDTLRDQARQDVRAAKQANPGLQPDTQFFSPRFRAFFAATSAGS